MTVLLIFPTEIYPSSTAAISLPSGAMPFPMGTPFWVMSVCPSGCCRAVKSLSNSYDKLQQLVGLHDIKQIIDQIIA